VTPYTTCTATLTAYQSLSYPQSESQTHVSLVGIMRTMRAG
jgi:hypothetical protein